MSRKAVTNKQTEDSVIRNFRITAADGKVTAEIAKAHAKSDFDRLIKQMVVIGDEKVGGKT